MAVIAQSERWKTLLSQVGSNSLLLSVCFFIIRFGNGCPLFLLSGAMLIIVVTWLPISLLNFEEKLREKRWFSFHQQTWDLILIFFPNSIRFRVLEYLLRKYMFKIYFVIKNGNFYFNGKMIIIIVYHYIFENLSRSGYWESS